MNFGFLTGEIDGTLSHWPNLQDPDIVKEILSLPVKPPTYNVIYRVPILDVEGFRLWE